MRFLLAILLFSTSALAADKKPIFFNSNEALPIELKFDISGLLHTNPFEEKLFPGTLTTGETAFPVEVQIRGNYRRALCTQLPPIKIVLPKGPKPAPFSHMDRDLKFVTNCHLNPEAELKYSIHRELLQYKLLEAAGFTTFRTRLTEVSYRIPEGHEYSKGPGFFIENIKDFAKRKGLDENSPAPEPEYLTAELQVAEAFLRNSDFFLPNGPNEKGHNVRRIDNRKDQALALIPYDFDLSQLSSMTPVTQTAISQMLGYAFNGIRPELVILHLNRLVERRAELLAEVERSPIPPEEKKTFTDWINGFLDAAKKLSVKPTTASS